MSTLAFADLGIKAYRCSRCKKEHESQRMCCGVVSVFIPTDELKNRLTAVPVLAKPQVVVVVSKR